MIKKILGSLMVFLTLVALIFCGIGFNLEKTLIIITSIIFAILWFILMGWLLF